MKFGVRKPSIKRSIKARTTGRAKRAIKKAVIPGYGKKGMGWINNPQKAAYNKVYNKTTIEVRDLIGSSNKKKGPSNSPSPKTNCNYEHKKIEKQPKRKRILLPIGEHQTTTQERIKETITYIILLFISFFLLAWAFSGWLVAGRILFVICCLIFIFLLKEVWTRKTTKEYKRVYEDELTEKEKKLLKK